MLTWFHELVSDLRFAIKTFAMILNYLKLALRLLMRKPFFSLLNILGLSVGFAVFLILWQYSESELNSDTQWKDHERIARLGFYWEWTDDGKNWEVNIGGINETAIPEKFAGRYPELESFTRMIRQSQFGEQYTGFGNRIIVSVEQPNSERRLFKEDKVACADANFFDFFSIPFLAGDRKHALTQPKSVVINRSTSRRYFGDGDALGKIILINNVAFVVSGVFEDIPSSSHMDCEIVISNAERLDYWAISRPHPVCFAYLKSKEILNWADFQNKVNEPATLKRDWEAVVKEFPNGRGYSLLEPVRNVAFSDWLLFSEYVPKSRVLLLAFRWIGVLVLALAIINYVSLNASHVSHRLKEIATRKVSGARSRDFFLQFSFETALTFLIAIALSLTLVQLFAMPLKLWLHIPVQQITANSAAVFAFVAFVAIMICTLYPVYASRLYHPRALLIKSSKQKTKRVVSLVSFQYSIAIMLLLCSVIIYNQITFLLNKDLGFKKDQVVIIDAPVVRTQNYEQLMEILQNRITVKKDVVQTTNSTTIMGDQPDGMTVRRVGLDYPVVIDANGGVDENFIPLYGLRLLAGRNFNKDEKGNVVILSEGALLRLGLPEPENSIGSRIQVYTYDLLGAGQWIDAEIIGVVKGYRLRPFIRYGNEYDKDDRGIGFTYKSGLIPSFTPEKIAIRIGDGNFEQTMSEIQEDFEELFPGNLFRWYFIDDNINQHYQSEKTRRNQIFVFTCLAIAIACLGLLGMISNKVVDKTKEIGIRKVLGAKLSHIASLILQSTAKQMIVAVIVSVPIAWYVAEQYLQNFSERIEQQWWHYALPVAVLITIMLCTIASVLWKAATTNPVESLRYE